MTPSARFSPNTQVGESFDLRLAALLAARIILVAFDVRQFSASLCAEQILLVETGPAPPSPIKDDTGLFELACQGQLLGVGRLHGIPEVARFSSGQRSRAKHQPCR